MTWDHLCARVEYFHLNKKENTRMSQEDITDIFERKLKYSQKPLNRLLFASLGTHSPLISASHLFTSSLTDTFWSHSGAEDLRIQGLHGIP